MIEIIARKFLIEGRVQGVFFRASTRSEAQRLGLRGHALNLRDGRVEVLAAGPAAAVGELAVWLETGPPGARVDALVVESCRPDAFAGLQGFRCGSR